MTNINLLPPEERSREEKERRKTSDIFGRSKVRYMQPAASKQAEAKDKTPSKKWFSFLSKEKKSEEKIKPRQANIPKAEKKDLPKKEKLVREFVPQPVKEKTSTQIIQPLKKSWFRTLREEKLKKREEEEVQKQKEADEEQRMKVQPDTEILATPKVKKEAKESKLSIWQHLKTWWQKLFPPAARVKELSLIAKKSPEAKKPTAAKASQITTKLTLEGKKKVGKIDKEKLEAEEEGLEVNLIPKDVLEQLNPQKKLLSLLLTILVVIGLTALIYYSLDWYQAKKVNEIQSLKDKLTVVEKKIKDLEAEKNEALNLQKRFLVAYQLTQRHIYWTRFFDRLEEYTIPQVYYTGFAGDVSGKLTLKAVATELRSLAKQIAVLKQASDFVQKVTVHSITAQTVSSGEIAGYNFNLELTLIPDLFLDSD